MFTYLGIFNKSNKVSFKLIFKKLSETKRSNSKYSPRKELGRWLSGKLNAMQT